MILNYKEKAFAYLFIYFQGVFSFVFQNKKIKKNWEKNVSFSENILF